MELSKLIDVRQNYEKSIKQKLLEFTTFFHAYMWDACNDDEQTDPKYLSDDDYKAIEALADKMRHMILNIGCPTSIDGMLQSIIDRKIKHWQSYDCVESDDKKRYVYDETKKIGGFVITSKGFKKGKQLKNNDDLRRVFEGSDKWYRQKNINSVISGHFRWNNRGYTLSRVATDALSDYYETKF